MSEESEASDSLMSIEQMQEIARENFAAWNAALQTGVPRQVAALYADDATFLPTMSNEFEYGQAGAERYFEHFLESNPIGEIIEGAVQPLLPTCYAHSGMYNFTVGLRDKREVVEARFTLIWRQNEEGAWKIIHHHSSVKP